jgi:hypothetical protein
MEFHGALAGDNIHSVLQIKLPRMFVAVKVEATGGKRRARTKRGGSYLVHVIKIPVLMSRTRNESNKLGTKLWLSGGDHLVYLLVGADGMVQSLEQGVREGNTGCMRCFHYLKSFLLNYTNPTYPLT